VVAPALREKGSVSELMLKAELLMDALATVTLEVVKFLIASVCVTLFPTCTEPYETDEGVEPSEDAWVSPGAAHMAAMPSNSAANKAKCRRPEPPGWMLFKAVCWETQQKRFWKPKNDVP